MEEIIITNKLFAQDVKEGLMASPKSLPSKYFYNDRGDVLFQKIMKLEEYYLTRAEYAIFNLHQSHLRELCAPQGEAFRLLEFGAGDGYKTKVLLHHLVSEQVDFTYQPIDISGHVLQVLESALRKELPNCPVEPIEADYFGALAALSAKDKMRKMVLFLGSNIGNFQEHEAQGFLKKLAEHLNPGDRVLIGFDLQKDPARILAAYNDSEGVTQDFNLNLLDRINEELGANFDREAFKHWPIYNPANGECKSYLLSKKNQSVRIEALNAEIQFDAWEPIYMEMSRKFTKNQINALADTCGYNVVEHLSDPKGDFVDSVWERR